MAFIKKGEKLVCRMLILVTQIGNLTSLVKHYARDTVGATKFGDVHALRDFAVMELGDAYLQLTLLTQELGAELDFSAYDVWRMAWARYYERKAEFEKKGMGDKWI